MSGEQKCHPGLIFQSRSGALLSAPLQGSASMLAANIPSEKGTSLLHDGVHYNSKKGLWNKPKGFKRSDRQPNKCVTLANNDTKLIAIDLENYKGNLNL